jgi:O-antigen/teichoic acid export membrane protein
MDRLPLALKKVLPTKQGSFRANFSWTFVGNLSYSICQWGFIVVMAKLASAEMLGQYALAFAISSPIYMFSNLGLSTVLATDRQDKYDFQDFLGFRLLASCLALACILLVSSFDKSGSSNLLVVMLVGFSKFVESIAEIGYGSLQKQERLELIAHSLILRGILALLGFAACLYLTGSLAAALLALVLIWTLILLLHDRVNVSKWYNYKPRLDASAMRSLFFLALPLGIIAGLGNLNLQIPRYLMEFFRDSKELGIFAAIAALSQIASLMTTALSQSALPVLARLFQAGELKRFKQLLLKLMGFGLVIGLGGVLLALLFGRLFLLVAYGTEYAAYSDVLVVIMAGAAITACSNFLGTGLSASQSFAVQTAIHVVKILLIAIVSLLLIPAMGALGAAWALFFANLFSALAYGWRLWQTIRVRERE